MYEDQPQELVHDLIAEAVFGNHPLGRPVIGTADVISTISRRAITAYHRAMYVPGNIVVSAAGQPRPQRAARARRARRARRSRRLRAAADGAAAAREAAGARPALPAEGHRAVPRLPRRARASPARPAPVRGLVARRHSRRLRLFTPLPGDPREAGHGLRRLHLRLPVHGHRTDRALRRHAGGEPRPRASRSRPSRSPTSRPATSGRTSSSGRRRTSRGGSCSRWSQRRAG